MDGRLRNMKKPKYMEEMLKIIFLCLGVSFVFVGVLSFVGVLKPKSSSVIQVPILLGTIFSVIGLFLVILSAILGTIVSKKNKLHSELLASGIKIEGVVEKVYLQKYTQYGKQSPYRILYAYTYQDRMYQHKSFYIWEKPNLVAGDPIMVYANEFGQSTISLLDKSVPN